MPRYGCIVGEGEDRLCARGKGERNDRGKGKRTDHCGCLVSKRVTCEGFACYRWPCERAAKLGCPIERRNTDRRGGLLLMRRRKSIAFRHPHASTGSSPSGDHRGRTLRL